MPSRQFATFEVAGQLFGVEVHTVQEVLSYNEYTPVPLAPKEIVGLLNLRGRVVTALCLRRRLGIPGREAGAAEMAIGLEQSGETFALIVDGVGEVLKLGADTQEPVPINLDARWRDISLGVHRLDGRLLVILDVDALLAFGDARESQVA